MQKMLSQLAGGGIPPGSIIKTQGFTSDDWNEKQARVLKYMPAKEKYAVEFAEPLNGALKHAVAEKNMEVLAVPRQAVPGAQQAQGGCSTGGG